MNDRAKKRSPWFYLGIGCAAALLVAAASLAALVYVGYRKARTFAEEMKDPVKRTAKVQRVLGCDRLPEGYHAIMSLSVPYVFDMAVLSDRALEDRSAGPDSERKGFIYLNAMGSNAERADLEAFIDGRKSRTPILERQRIHIDARKTLHRGSLVSGDATIRYVCQRGGVRMHEHDSKGLVTIQLIECSSDQRLRVGIWFAPDPAPDTPSENVDFTGTPADEEALSAFLGHFRFCR